MIGQIVNSKYYHYIQYLSFFVFTYLLSWACLDRSVSEWLPKFSLIISECNVPVRTSVYCYGFNTIYRINLALVFFYLTNLVVLIVFHGGFLDYYLARWVYFLLLGVVSMVLPSILIKMYIVVAFVGSVVFIFLNVATLLDLTVQVGQYVSRHLEKIGLYRCYLAATILTPILSLIVDLFGLLLHISYVAIWLILLNLGLKMAVCLQYFWPYIWSREMPKNCFLSVGIVFLSNSITLLTALESGSVAGSSITGSSIMFNSLFTIGVLLWSSYSIANFHNFLRLTQSDYSENIFTEVETTNMSTSTSETCGDILADILEKERRFWRRLQQMRVFFMVMILSTFALLTSLTSWQFYDGHPNVQIDTGVVSMWVKVVTIVVVYVGFMVVRRLESSRVVELGIFDNYDITVGENYYISP